MLEMFQQGELQSLLSQVAARYPINFSWKVCFDAPPREILGIAMKIQQFRYIVEIVNQNECY